MNNIAKIITIILFFFVSSSFAQEHKLLRKGTTITRGNSVWSNDQRYELSMQEDGNLVLYKKANGVVKALWATNTDGKAVKYFIFQRDGNMVLYDFANKPVWASGTNNKGASYLLLQNDGNLVIYQADGHAIWATGTFEKN